MCIILCVLWYYCIGAYIYGKDKREGECYVPCRHITASVQTSRHPPRRLQLPIAMSGPFDPSCVVAQSPIHIVLVLLVPFVHVLDFYWFMMSSSAICSYLLPHDLYCLGTIGL